MGTTVRQFLQSLCCDSCWNYAVFWKLEHQSQMLLTWEDGYTDIPTQGHSMESILNNISVEGLPEMSSSNYESSTYHGILEADAVGAAVAYMSNRQYPFGDGIVGKVASTGTYCWVFSGDILSGEFSSKLIPECPEEWMFQFAAGIKTILLLPVVPHGVLQLGSLESVEEDLSMVALIEEMFVNHQHFVGNSESVAVGREFLAPSSSLLMSALIENLDELSALAINAMKSEDLMPTDNVKPSLHKSFTVNQFTPPHIGQDLTHISGKDLIFSNSSREDDVSTQVGVVEVLPDALHQALNFTSLGTETAMYRCLEKELPSISYANNLNSAMFEEYANKMAQSDGLMSQGVANDNCENTRHDQVGSFLSFPRDCELHKALGPAVVSNVHNYPWDSCICVEDVYRPSGLLCNGDLTSGREVRETNGWLVRKNDPDHLLEPVVAQTHLNTDSSRKIDGQTSSMTFSGIFNASAKEQNQTERSSLSRESTICRSHVTFEPISMGRNTTVNTSPAAASYGSMMSELIEEEQKTIFSSPNQRKISKVSGVGKRRAKSGDNSKPRPRDRQLIQDRLKELRELVPNGSKCSIDALLDRTVAHMLFLKSVGDRVDKLRHWIPQEGVGRKNVKSPEQKGGHQSGTSWAVELGKDQQVCPIIVEDLEYPGHMLIEMLCDENDRFLEIAEVVHGLDLTILKGVMEKRSDNTWAHFVIEAPRGLHRLDIFWPLMKLLQQQRSPISSKI